MSDLAAVEALTAASTAAATGVLTRVRTFVLAVTSQRLDGHSIAHLKGDIPRLTAVEAALTASRKVRAIALAMALFATLVAATATGVAAAMTVGPAMAVRSSGEASVVAAAGIAIVSRVAAPSSSTSAVSNTVGGAVAGIDISIPGRRISSLGISDLARLLQLLGFIELAMLLGVLVRREVFGGHLSIADLAQRPDADLLLVPAPLIVRKGVLVDAGAAHDDLTI